MPNRRSSFARPLGLGLLATVLLGLLGVSCSDRRVKDPGPPPDIEGLCQAHCERVMECRWFPGDGSTFSNEQECRRNCEAGAMWGKCPRETEAMYACATKYDCPEFANIGFDYPEGDCSEEIRDWVTCPSRRSR